MRSHRVSCLVAACGLALVASGQHAPKIMPVPGDPLELAAGQVPVAATNETRPAALNLLARARDNFLLRSTGQGYDLKINFQVDSQGQTNFDGAWELEDLYIPRQGLRWTAKAAAGYAITGIASKGELYGEGTSNVVPLRLEEARGILLHPLPSADYANRESIRTAQAKYNGVPVTCVLLSNSTRTETPGMGRRWDESEECIDPESGLLQIHSEVPGRYVAYDYANAPGFGGHTLPRTVTVTEAGRIVSKISVEQLQEMPSAEPALFTPTETMRAKGRSIEMTSATKVTRVHGKPPFTSAMSVRVVCVFGIVTPTGQLVEAHSLQPSDPNSEVALEDAKQIDFTPSTPNGAQPRQHFVFVIEKFVSK
jgi:hypothetical protein